MKVTKTFDEQICDVCQKEVASYFFCRGCGKALCRLCWVPYFDTIWGSSLHATGSTPTPVVVYCPPCNAKALLGPDALEEALFKIVVLAEEHRRWLDDFGPRGRTAETLVALRLEKEKEIKRQGGEKV